jgi:hypothetical protein
MMHKATEQQWDLLLTVLRCHIIFLSLQADVGILENSMDKFVPKPFEYFIQNHHSLDDFQLIYHP